ncbi:hypothetical protein AVEN_230179-1 [Araneus ventricosus]|uniref:Uncharacterized protein n=1 Tax=Araneus ventricosus TaxID=182803 RepID=A0A4Y2PI05_ARAVE|nr:hypothetical protein AVEN_230179-1 [Araneus ventricosus]
MAADHKVCIIMLGECGVGKTALLLRFCESLYRGKLHSNYFSRFRTYSNICRVHHTFVKMVKTFSKPNVKVATLNRCGGQ